MIEKIEIVNEDNSLMSLKNVLKKREEFQLSIPELKLKRGRIYAVLGSNGSGKTTLMKLLALLDDEYDGEIFYGQEAVSAKNNLKLRRCVTMVIEEPYLFNGSVYNNIAVGLWCNAVARQSWKERISRAVSKVILDGFERRECSKLSNGERHRVAIARALALNPELVLLDEPFSNVDKETMRVIEKTIMNLAANEGTTVVFSTHDDELALRLANEAITIVDGTIIEGIIENRFRGSVERRPNGTKVVLSQDVVVDVVTDGSGEVLIAVPPEDIILALKNVETSARNSFAGTVKRVNINDRFVRVFVELAGGIELIAVITKESYEAMSLHPGLKIYAIFKSTSVKVFG